MALLTVNDAAKELGIIPARVRQLIADGTIPAQRFGWAWIIRPQDLTRARRRKTAPGPAKGTPAHNKGVKRPKREEVAADAPA